MLFRKTSLLLGSMIFVVACGSSRPTQRNCAKTNAVYQANSSETQSQLKPWEERDPSAAILLFKATSSKITIESRCNARLLHKLNVLPKNADGSFSQPLDFSNISFSIENNKESMELHSSNHCFFRIWDPRVKSQVENNPSIGVEPVKSILSNPLNRYHLYKSLLTSPQKLIVFDSNGKPVEFEYRISHQEIYTHLFQKIDALASDTYRSVVGREFSKSSVILDELGLDVCGAQEKLLQRIDAAGISDRRAVTDAPSFKDFFENSEHMKDSYRRALLNSGRNKTCISQTDFVVVPVKFTQPLSAEQKAITEEIHVKQTFDANALQAKMRGIFSNSATEIGAFVPEILLPDAEKSTFVQNTLKLNPTCTPWLEQYPGLMVTAPISAQSSKRLSQFSFKANHIANVEDASRRLFPNLAKGTFSNPFAALVISKSLNALLKEKECILKGFDYHHDHNPENSFCKDGLMTNKNVSAILEIDSRIGACPPAGEAYRIYAAKVHLNVLASIRLAMSTTIMNLEKHRENHKMSLFLPIAQLRDVTKGELYEMLSQNERSVFNRTQKILDELDAKYPESTRFYSGLKVTSVGTELDLKCSLVQRSPEGTLPDGEVDVSHVYNNLSREGQGLTNAGFTRSDAFRYYRNFAARYLMTRCINAPSQILFSDWNTVPGLHQFLRDTRISFIASDSLPAANQLSLSNKELIETGRPISVSLQQFILPRKTLEEKTYQHEINAYLLAEGHVEVAYCYKQSLVRGAAIHSFCEINLVHRDFLKYYKGRFANEFAPMGRLALFDPDSQFFSSLVSQGMAAEKPTPKVFADALPSLSAHLNILTAIPRWYPQRYKEQLGGRAYPNDGFDGDSGMYALGPGDSGTTISLFGLFPAFMVSAVNDVPVSGGLAVIPSTGGQDVPTKGAGACR